MAVPSTFADLSTTPGSNSGLISDSTAVNQIDNHLQTVYALIASIYANSGNGWASTYLPAANPVYTGTLTGGTGVVNLGSGQIYKASGGDVGIGTTTPSSKLDVVGLDGSGVQFRTGTRTVGMGSVSGEAAVYWGSSTVLTFFSGSERMRIDSSGNVGIGGTPSFPLDVVNSSARIRIAPATTTNSALLMLSNGGNNSFLGLDNSAAGLGSEAYSLNIHQGGAYSIVMATNGSERMRIDAIGNQINIPSNTPPTLTVNGQFNITPTTNTNARISYRGSDGVTRTADITLA